MVAMDKTAVVLGAGGFIGSHMVKRLKKEGYWVRGVDLKECEFEKTEADEFIYGDLQDPNFVNEVLRFHGKFRNFYRRPPKKYHKPFDEVYQFAADMGGAGFVFTGENDADIMHNSGVINLNVVSTLKELKGEFENAGKVFYSSSACMYPEYNQMDTENPNLAEDSAYPANPDSDYGWEKLFSERLYLAFHRNHELNIRIARYHNIYGVEGTWDGGREKSPAAFCRKIAEVQDGGEIECWGDGEQTRSFLYIDECIEATRRLMESDFKEPINIGSEEMVSINQMIEIISKISSKSVTVKHIEGPEGVRGRNSNNALFREVLGWDYSMSLEAGLTKTYNWISGQLKK